MGIVKTVGRVRLVLTILVVFIAYRYGNLGVPEDMPVNGYFRISTAMFKLLGDVCNIASLLGFGEPMLIGRSVFETLYPILDPTQPEPGVQFADHDIAGVSVRIYTPEGTTDNSPAIVYMHGGGWVMGSKVMHHIDASRVAKRTGLVVFSVDYRRAPEHIFPAAFDDCYQVTMELLSNGAKFNINSRKVVIMGDSAGGNLALAVSLKLRDDAWGTIPQPLTQILIYPALQALDMDTPSYQLNKDGIVLMSREEMVAFWLYYAQGHLGNLDSMVHNNHTTTTIKQQMASELCNHDAIPQEHIHEDYSAPKSDFGDPEVWTQLKGVFLNPYFAPLMAGDFTDLPSAFVLSCHYDVLRDDSLWLVQLLKEAENEVTHYHERHGHHPMLKTFFGGTTDAGQKALDHVIDYIVSKTSTK